MAITILPGFQTLSEFGQYHGDCGECATLAALHALDPGRWPLTLDTLNHLTTAEIAAGNADPSLSGGQNIPNMSAYLDKLGVSHTVVGYDTFTPDALHADLKANAGVHPLVVEWANGGVLEGNTVHYHYSACGGVDTGPAGDGIGGAYLWADGDNRASGATPGAPIRYDWPQIVAAQPCGYIVITQTPATTGGSVPHMAGIPAGWQDDGTTLTAPNGIPVVHGFRDTVLLGWDANNVPLEAERHYDELVDSNPSFGSGQGQQFKASRLIWNAQIGVMDIALGMGDDIMALRAQLAAAQAQTQTQAQEESQEAQALFSAANVASFRATLTQAQQQASALSQELQTALTSLPQIGS